MTVLLVPSLMPDPTIRWAMTPEPITRLTTMPDAIIRDTMTSVAGGCDGIAPVAAAITTAVSIAAVSFFHAAMIVPFFCPPGHEQPLWPGRFDRVELGLPGLDHVRHPRFRLLEL